MLVIKSVTVETTAGNEKQHSDVFPWQSYNFWNSQKKGPIMHPNPLFIIQKMFW